MKRLLSVIFLICTANLWAATYYVANTGSDSNNGTSPSTAWATFTHADSVVGPGDTVIVESGTYTSLGCFSLYSSGTSTSPITYRAVDYPGHGRLTGYAVILAPTTSCQEMIHVNGNNNIFEGFEFSGANAAIEDGIKLDFPNGSSAGGQVLGNLFTLFGLVHGCSGGGPILSGQQNAIIDSNVLYANGGTPGTSGTGCQQEDGIYINNGNGTTVTNNIVINHGGGCVGPLSQCNVGSPLQINDEFSGDQRNFPSNVNMSNNTVVNSGNMVYWECYLSGFVCSNVWTNNNLLVNINNFHNLTGTAITLGTIGSGTFGSGIQFVSDLWYQGATGFCAQGQQPGGLACPGSVSGAVTSNPLFVNNRGDLTGDYHLQAGSPAIAAGTSSGCPSHDFEGNPRTGVCTIGAYAYGGSGSAPPPNPPMGLTATVN